jgi:hypothetical protein
MLAIMLSATYLKHGAICSDRGGTMDGTDMILNGFRLLHD